MSTKKEIKQLLEIHGVVKVQEESTLIFGEARIKVVAKHDSPSLRKQIAYSLSDIIPAGLSTQGNVEEVVSSSDGNICYLVRFDLEVERSREEGSSCWDTTCGGTMEVDHSKCTCGTSSGAIGPCGNCESGLNLTCSECNRTLEEFMEEEEDGMTMQEENVRAVIRDAKKGALIFARENIQKLIDEEGRGRDVYLYIFAASDASRYTNFFSEIIYLQGLSSKEIKWSNAAKKLISRIETDSGRQTGRTYNQIKNLKKGALFIASHDVTDTLMKLNRPDVIMYILGRHQPRILRELDITDVVFDHYVEGKPIRSDLSSVLYDIRRRIKEKEDKMKKVFTSPEVKVRLSTPSESLVVDMTAEDYRRSIISNCIPCGSVGEVQPMKLEVPNELIKTQKEHDNMTTLNRKQVEVTLMDNDPSLKASKALVFSTKVTSDGSNEDVIRKVLFDGDIAEALEQHNAMRKKIVDLGILERVGNEVMLRAVELEDLTWTVA